MKESTTKSSIFDKMTMSSHLTTQTPNKPELSQLRKELLAMAKSLKINEANLGFGIKSFDQLSDEKLAEEVRKSLSNVVSKGQEFDEITDAIRRLMSFMYFGPRSRWY